MKNKAGICAGLILVLFGAASAQQSGVPTAILSGNPPAEAVRPAQAVKANGFEVSLSYLAVPVKYYYLEAISQLTMVNTYGYPSIYLVSYSCSEKNETFTLGSAGLRFTQMHRVSDSVSAGIEFGIGVPTGGKTYSYSAGQTVMGTTQTVRHDDEMDVFYTQYGPLSTSVSVKSLSAPLFARMELGAADPSAGTHFFVGVGLGMYFMLSTIETTYNTWSSLGNPLRFKNTTQVTSLLPAAELSGGGKFKLTDNMRFSVSGIMGYSLKGPVMSIGENNVPGVNYRDGFEIGGLAYGGKAGLSLLF